MILDSGFISNASAYFSKVMGLDIDELPIDWDETGDTNLISIDEFNSIGKIISLEVSLYCLRRLGNCCQSNSDNISSLLSKEIKNYNSNYKKEFVYLNDDLIF